MDKYENVSLIIPTNKDIGFVPALATSLVSPYYMWVYCMVKKEPDKGYSWHIFTDMEMMSDKILGRYMFYVTDRNECNTITDNFISVAPKLNVQPTGS